MPDYCLILRPKPSPVPEPVRLRRAVKSLLRSWDLVCVDFWEIAEGAPRGAVPAQSREPDPDGSDRPRAPP